MHKLKPEYIKLDESKRLYGLSCPVIGLTGGIGTGKSSAAKVFKKQGFLVIDADQLVKEVYALEESLTFVKKICPTAIENKKINFNVLREHFFQSEDLKQKIEKYIYSKLPETFLSKVNEQTQLIIYDCPLLFETGLHTQVDFSLLIYAPYKTQIARVRKRDGSSPELVKKIVSRQMDIEKKRSLADSIIENTRDFSHLEQKVQFFIDNYL